MISKKTLVTGLVVAVVILGGIGGYALIQNNEEASNSEIARDESSMPAPQMQASSAAEEQAEASGTATKDGGRYVQYSSAKLAESDYSTSVIFFYAPWCPECRSFKQATNDSTIPEGTQILEADYDSSTDLKKQYGVTLQSTFVRVNSTGELQKKWVGYGKDKSLQTVLNNVN